MKKYYTSKYDKVFKTIICNDNKKFLKAILETILNIKIDTIDYLKNELPVDTYEEKSKIVDLLVKSNNKIIHLELNTNSSYGVRFRNFIYFTTAIAQDNERGKAYKIDSNYYHIDLDFDLSDKKDMFTSYYIQSDNKDKYVDNVKLVEINMDKVKKNCYIDGSYKYLAMLDMTPNELDKISKGDEIIMEYKSELEKVNNDSVFVNYISREEENIKMNNTLLESAEKRGKELGLEQGIEQGIEQGKVQEKINILKRLIDNNTSIEAIISILNITEDDYDKYINIINSESIK